MSANLTTADNIITGIAVAILAMIVVRWLACSRRDPLSGSPLRDNRVNEETLVLTIMGYLLASLVVSGLVKLAIPDFESPLAKTLLGIATQVSGIAICLIIAATHFTGGIRRFLLGDTDRSKRFWPVLLMVTTLLALGICPLVRDATISVIYWYAPNYQPPEHPTIEWLHDPNVSAFVPIALWISAALLAPIAEELFFRGFVQTFISNRTQSRWLAIAASSLLFGAIHFQQPWAVPALIVLAIVLGYTYERTGSLLLPIAIHSAFNLKTLIFNALGGDSI